MKIKILLLVTVALFSCREACSQKSEVLEKTKNRTFPDVEQPSLLVAPAVYYTPARIFLTPKDTVSEFVYWRRNFTDQFLETWSDPKMYPASRIFGFIQDSIYFRSTAFDQYHIFAPQIFSGPIDLYYTRYIQNLGEIRMVSVDPNNLDYHNNMIVTGDVPRRYANEFTFFVTFPWDTLKMVPVSHKTLPKFADLYLRVYPDAYREARKYDISHVTKVLTYTLIPVAVIGISAFLLVQDNPVYFIAVGAGAMVSYIAVKIFLKPRTLDPEGMIRIIEKCR